MGGTSLSFLQALAVTLLRASATLTIIYSAVSLFDFIWQYLQLQVWSDAETQAQNAQTVSVYIGMIAGLTFSIAVAAALLFAAPWLSRRIVPLPHGPEPLPAFPVHELVGVGVFLVGFWFVLERGPRAIADTATVLVAIMTETEAERLSSPVIRSVPDYRLILQWIGVLVALAAMLRARDVGRLFGWLRNAGVAPGEPAPASDERPA